MNLFFTSKTFSSGRLHIGQMEITAHVCNAQTRAKEKNNG